MTEPHIVGISRAIALAGGQGEVALINFAASRP